MSGEAFAAGWHPSLRPEVVLREDEVRGEKLVVQPERLGRLNGTAFAILQLCDGTRTVDEITAAIRSTFDDAPPDGVAGSIERFLRSAVAERWIR